MSDIDSDFSGSIPEIYDTYLVPILFEGYAHDLARRVARTAPTAVLEIAAGSGAVTRALAPLLGLMGTVTGMVAVFDAMATQGGNARSMASGVSMATIPTMAGMVASLSGVLATTFLQGKVDRETELFEDHLTMDH